ncbi:MAG: hypothetical protein ACM3JI_03220, partial [Anaerolineae bacterium]
MSASNISSIHSVKDFQLFFDKHMCQPKITFFGEKVVLVTKVGGGDPCPQIYSLNQLALHFIHLGNQQTKFSHSDKKAGWDVGVGLLKLYTESKHLEKNVNCITALFRSIFGSKETADPSVALKGVLSTKFVSKKSKKHSKKPKAHSKKSTGYISFYEG